MKIAILGGSFDPPHNGHKLIAEQILNRLSLDQVWLMPGFAHPFNKNISSAKHRLAMTKFLETSQIRVSDLETARQGVSYSIDTLDELKKQFPQDSFTWIIGSDQIKDFPKWKSWESIIKTYGLIVFPRGSISYEEIKHHIQQYLLLKGVPKTIQILANKDMQTSDLSSTSIREKVKHGESIHGLVPDAVKRYITQHKLYR